MEKLGENDFLSCLYVLGRPSSLSFPHALCQTAVNASGCLVFKEDPRTTLEIP